MKKDNSWHGKYEEEGSTSGGNANVYFVKNKMNGDKAALKELHYKIDRKTKEKKFAKEAVARFKNEIKIINDNYREISGIIPIINFCEEECWYTMPIAEPILKHIESKNIRDIISGVIELSETLNLLHNKGISHRDIKPANIYYYNKRFYFGDFGLVDFPDKFDNLTKINRGLGAVFTIAPEMKRNPHGADGKKADVFSLAKTMWMFLSGDEKGFDGVYDYMDKSHSLQYINKYKDTYLVEIQELLRECTNNNPDSRPTIMEFKNKLVTWLDIEADKDKSQASDWNFLSKQLFGLNPPSSSSWRNADDIITVLNIIGRTPAYNHMLLHNHGGLDFSHAEVAAEDGCIKIYDTLDFCKVVKPKILYFEGFDKKYEWNYFLLELDNLKPVFDDNVFADIEDLIEDKPAHYVSAEFAQYGVYDYDEENVLPQDYQEISRYIKGKFLFVLKNGPYNGINGTYDGRHGDCNAQEFCNYINSLIERYSEIFNDAKQEESLKDLPDEELEQRILNLNEFDVNPFKPYSPQQTINHDVKKIKEDENNKEYISVNFNQWDFKSLLENTELLISTKIKFAFAFITPGSFFSVNVILGMDNYICNDGYIKKLNASVGKDCYYVYDRELAIQVKNKLNHKVSEFLPEDMISGIDEYQDYFSIELIKVGKPTHLFTKQEISDEMKQADDRHDSQLVIDENGYAKIIQNIEYAKLFPVRHESWNSGNKYVGKYSNLSSLDDAYISSLQGWLLYLENGQQQYMDYVHENRSEDVLLIEINKYY